MAIRAKSIGVVMIFGVAQGPPRRRPADGGVRGHPRPVAVHHPATAIAPAADPIPTAAAVAHRLGWLACAGAAEVETRAVEDGMLVTVRQDPVATLGAIREGGNVGALWARANGADTRLLGLTWVDEYQAILAAPDAPIAEPADLEDRRLALPLRDWEPIDAARAAACRGFHAATALAGIFANEVTYVDVDVDEIGSSAATDPDGDPQAAAESRDAADPYAAEVAALQRGEVDAIFVAGAAGAAVRARIGAREVVDLGAQLDPMVRAGARTPATLTADARLLKAQPDLVVQILATLLRAGSWAQESPADLQAIVAEASHTEPQHVAAAYGARLHEQLHLDLSAHKLAALVAQHDHLRTHGFLDADVDLAAWIDPGPLAAARDLLASAAPRAARAPKPVA